MDYDLFIARSLYSNNFTGDTRVALTIALSLAVARDQRHRVDTWLCEILVKYLTHVTVPFRARSARRGQRQKRSIQCVAMKYLFK